MGRVIEMPLPRLGETMEEGRIGVILKKPGEAFRRGETLLEVESDKTTVEVPALQDGVIVEWLVASDQMVAVESAIARIEIEGEAVAEAKRPAAAAAPAVAVATPAIQRAPRVGGPRPRASTAARAAARRAGIDLSGLRGTGRNGRVTRADVAEAHRPSRATYHAETPLGRIFFREWPEQGQQQGLVLLLHGLFADSQSFTTLGRKLAARGYRVMAADLPGHGATESSATTADAMAAAIRAALPPVNLHILGHSFGAVVAAQLLDRALSLTLLAPAGCGEEINGAFIAAMLAGGIDRAAGFLGETIPAESQAALAGQIAENGTLLRAIAGELAEDGQQKLSILATLGKAVVPVRAVFMRDDRVIPARHALNMPFNVAVHVLEGAGHLPHWRNPDAIAGLLDAS